MATEIKNFITVWLTVIASLIYSYIIPRNIPKGKLRLLSLLPIITLFTLLPLKLSTVTLSGTTGFFIAWLANFKLLLFAFDLGPLSSHSSLSLPHFILFACLPIKSKQTPSQKISKTVPFSIVIKVVLLALLFQIYPYKEHLHPIFLLFLYCFHIYFMLEIILTFSTAMARSILRLELEPPFEQPYFSTSLQDFWGKRWNLMVTNILRPTVYDPVKRISSRWFGRQWGLICGTVATFVVSGLMHELMFFYLCRLPPSWEVMRFFVLHGVCLVVEIQLKNCFKEKKRLHPVVSTTMTVGFVAVTSFWLFFPQLLRGGVDVEGVREGYLLFEFVKGLGLTMKPSLSSCGDDTCNQSSSALGVSH